MGQTQLLPGDGKVGGLTLKRGVRIVTNAGAPTSGTTGTGAGKSGPGSLCIDATNGVVYVNNGTKASPSWSAMGGGVAAGAPAGTGVTAVDYGSGNFRTTKLTFTNTPVVLADAAGVVAYGSLKVYDFPQGYIYVESALTDIALTKSSAGVIATWDGDVAVGTAACAGDATLTSTEADIIPSTATPQAVAGATTADAVSTASQHVIHDGTGTAKDAYVNLLVDDADHDVTGTPCNLIMNGTMIINWLFMGDN